MIVILLPSWPRSSSARTDTGTAPAQLQPLGAHAARAQPALQRTRDDVEEHVVDGAAERVLDRLELGQVGVDPDHAPVRAAVLVERGLRRARDQARGHLAHRLDGVAGLPERAARVGHRGHRVTGQAERRAHEVGHPLGRDGRVRRLGRRRPRVGGAVDRVGVAVEVEQHRGDVHAADAVDQAVVGLVDEREAVGLEPVHEPDLPQRLGAVQALGEDPAGQQAQLLEAPRRRAAP